MKSFPVDRTLWMVMLQFAATTFSLSAQPDETSITPTNKTKLFNGKSPSDRTFVSRDTNAPAASIWSVRNGVTARQGRPNEYARTLQSYRDYKLHAEWRFPAGPGNCGVVLHVNPPDKVWPLCLEAHCNPAAQAKCAATAARWCIN